MDRAQIFEQIRKKGSFLCVGLDTDYNKLPEHLRGMSNPIFEFNRAIIDATAPYTVAYKPNLAFYEALASTGINAFHETCRYIKSKYPEMLVIADAKRGDIGNTSDLYAEAFFGANSAKLDAITLSPYMGSDTVKPFLKYEDKWAVILALTSNPSADDFETLPMADGRPLWKQVLETAKTWGTPDNTMFVVGATRAETLREVREIVPDHFLLVPGVGAQGGSLEEVARYGMNSRCGLLVNSSRGIIYADSTEKFAEIAGRKASEMAAEMASLMTKYI